MPGLQRTMTTLKWLNYERMSLQLSHSCCVFIAMSQILQPVSISEGICIAYIKLFNCVGNLVRAILRLESQNSPLPGTVPAITEVMDYLSLVSLIHMSVMYSMIKVQEHNLFFHAVIKFK